MKKHIGEDGWEADVFVVWCGVCKGSAVGAWHGGSRLWS